MPTTTPKNESINRLGDVAVGLPVRIRELCGEPGVCQRLREMGFCEFAEICKVAQGEALICRIANGRVILSERLAENILVESIPKKT